MPDIHDPAMGSGGFISPGGPRGPDGIIGPSGNGANKLEEPERGSLKGRRVSTPPAGNAAKAAEKANPAIAKVAAQSEPQAPLAPPASDKFQKLKLAPKNNQPPSDAKQPAADGPNAPARLISQVYSAIHDPKPDAGPELNGQPNGNKSPDSAQENGIPQRVMQEASAPPRQVEDSPGLVKHDVMAAASAPDLADMKPDSPIDGAPAAAPADGLPAAPGGPLDDASDPFALFYAKPELLAEAKRNEAAAAAQQSPGAAPDAGAPAPQGPDSGRNVSAAPEAAAEEAPFEVASAESLRQLFTPKTTVNIDSLNSPSGAAKPIDHKTKISRDDLKGLVFQLPGQNIVHVFVIPSREQRTRLQQQYPGHKIVYVPEELHDHAFELVQKHIDAKKQEHAKNEGRKQPTHQRTAGNQNVNLSKTVESQREQLSESISTLIRGNDVKFNALRDILKMILRQATKEHGKEAKERLEKLEELIIQSKEETYQILKSEVKVEDLKKIESKLIALKADLDKEEQKLSILLS